MFTKNNRQLQSTAKAEINNDNQNNRKTSVYQQTFRSRQSVCVCRGSRFLIFCDEREFGAGAAAKQLLGERRLFLFPQRHPVVAALLR